MSWFEVLRSVRSMASAPGRLALTLFGIVIGSGAVVVIMGLAEGGRQALLATNQGVTGSDLIVVSARRASEPERRRGLPRLSRGDGHAVSLTRLLAGRPVHADSGRDVRAYWRGRNKRVRIVSGNPPMLGLYRIRVARGRFLVPSDLTGHRRVCVVGHEIYVELLRRHPIDGDLALHIDGTRWQVVGVLENKPMLGSTSGTHIWARKVIVPATTFDLRYAPDHRADRLIVKAARSPLDAVRGAIRAVIGLRHAGADNYKLDDPRGRRQEQLILTVVEMLLVGTGGLALFVGGINVMNVMLVRVTERTQEIGLRRALGATRSNVLRQFLFESVLLSAVGGLCGIAQGSAILAAGTWVLRQAVGQFPLVVPPLALLLGGGLSLAVGLAFGALPAWRAARLDPVSALRQD